MSANAVSLQQLQAAVESQRGAGRGAADQAVESQRGAGRGAADPGVVSKQNMHPVRNHDGLCCGDGLAVRLCF